MLHFMMTNQYFYYGIIAAGVLGLLSAVLTGLYYRMIVRDLKRVRKPKGKWMRSFINELDNRKMLQQNIQNADAFIRSRLASGNILRWYTPPAPDRRADDTRGRGTPRCTSERFSRYFQRPRQAPGTIPLILPRF